MLSSRLAATLSGRGIYYGWVVAAVTFLTMLVTAAAVGAPGVLIVPLEKEFGWQTAEISSALAVRLLLFGLMGPFAAAFMNRFGLRRVILTALSLIGGGMLASLAMTQVWQLVMLWGVVVGFGTGLVALVLGATVATRWFTERRGLVIGLLTASSATGQLVFLPLMAQITDHLGWRSALLLVCALQVVAAIAVILLMRDRPSDLGLAPYGESAVVPPAPNTPSLWSLVTAPLEALRDASRTGIFWVLFATFFICGASTNGLIQTHFISLCGDYGLAAVSAAGVLAMMGIFDFVGTVGSGWLSDRYDNRWLLFWYYGLRGLSLLYLPFTDFSFYGLSLFAMFYGLDWIATVPPTVKLAAQHFGRERANLVFGWIFAGHQLGAATAAFGAGLSRTVLDSYLPAFFVAGALCLIASALVLLPRRHVAQPVAAQ
ncbi:MULTISPECIES: MFS transporter [unclassified Beijerinckia]|uniref:MFS transporter n=1 Tax=unclassified Beijerinckia TaxID=2638183 RepID=UPI00089BEE9C|nr:MULTISPECIES: MFS transporter [unclassified Beijerinckia]MDH7797762.1 putative MFS family arabinose efflux permease [Beijerinckia sp. GAS462]SEC97706.1 Predicted arabinose efflux permease, MFS family [Beijerinckia sp. 28-YEA-48]